MLRKIAIALAAVGFLAAGAGVLAWEEVEKQDATSLNGETELAPIGPHGMLVPVEEIPVPSS